MNLEFFDTHRFTFSENLKSEEVLLRIEILVLSLLAGLKRKDEVGGPFILPLSLVNRGVKNRIVTSSQTRLGFNIHTKTASNNGIQSYTRVWRILSFVYSALFEGRKSTQREAFYSMISDFSNQKETNSSVQDVIALLNCTRKCLGLMATSKGEVVGRLKILEISHTNLLLSQSNRKNQLYLTQHTLNPQPSLQYYPSHPFSSSSQNSFNKTLISQHSLTPSSQHPTQRFKNSSQSPVWYDCFSVPRPISGDFSLLSRFDSDAKYIIVIEKDGIFQRLFEDRIHMTLPCILVCGKGYPDLATRVLVRGLSDQLKIPVLGVVDYNVHGLAILLTYKLGSVRMGLETFRYTVDIKWLGLRKSQISELELPASTLQDLTQRDVWKSQSLLKHPFIQNNQNYLNEVEGMLALKKKAELQSLYHFGFGFVAKFLIKRILIKDWI